MQTRFGKGLIRLKQISKNFVSGQKIIMTQETDEMDGNILYMLKNRIKDCVPGAISGGRTSG